MGVERTLENQKGKPEIMNQHTPAEQVKMRQGFDGHECGKGQHLEPVMRQDSSLQGLGYVTTLRPSVSGSYIVSTSFQETSSWSPTANISSCQLKVTAQWLLSKPYPG